MKYNKIAVAIFAAASMSCASAVSAEYDVSDLGGDLTAWGAINAGNESGTIPPYTGGIQELPEAYDPARPDWRPDPFADEKPRLVINQSNYKEHADKLGAGLIQMFEKYPSFEMNVYPTHRSVAYDEQFLENSKANATRCDTQKGVMSIDTSQGCGLGLPFPIPENGLEAMWNVQIGAERPTVIWRNYQGKYVKPDGEIVHSYTANFYRPQFWYEEDYQPVEHYYGYRMEYLGPSRLAGTNTANRDSVQDGERAAYLYSPATRRVRLSPDSAADTPVSQVGGAMTYDDDQLFAGKKDRFEWKLVGRKEMYIPYNNFRYIYTPEDDEACVGNAKYTPLHPKNECVRWELHRVWHIEGVLKDGERHVYAKRDIFVNEDTWTDGYSQMYDHSGNLYRMNWQMVAPMYDAKTAGTNMNMVLDLVSGVYAALGMEPGYGVNIVEPLPASVFAPATLSRRMIDLK